MSKLLIVLMTALIGASAFGASHVFMYNCITNGYNLQANPGPALPSDVVKHEGMIMTSMCRQREGNVDAGFNIGNYDCGMGGPGFCGVIWVKDLMNMDAATVGEATFAAVRGEYRDEWGGGCTYINGGNIKMKYGIVDYTGNIDGVWGSADDVPATATWMDPSNLLNYSIVYNTDTTRMVCEDTVTFVVPEGSQNSYENPLDKHFCTLNVTKQVNWILNHTGANKGKYSGQYAIAFVVNQKQNAAGGKLNLYADESGNMGQSTNDPWTTDANSMHLFMTTEPAGANVIGTISVEKNPLKAASVVTLAQNAPNPFTSSTEISFNTLGKQGVLKIYSANGALVYRSQVSGDSKVVWNAKNMANGIYQCRLVVGNETLTTKMILMK